MPTRFPAAILFALLVLPAAGCPSGETFVQLAEVADERIVEASGIVASRRHPGHYYVHNDSGDEARVFVLDSAGKTRTVLKLAGASAIDWEDIAIAPGVVGSVGAVGEGPASAPADNRVVAWDVCVGDIGDNAAQRASIFLYRFPEPAGVDASAEQTVTPTAYECRYPDGAHDAEALFVHPASGAAYILTKNLDGQSTAYKLVPPWRSDQVNELVKVGPLNQPPSAGVFTTVTAADVSADGRRLITRSYAAAWERTLGGDRTLRGERTLPAGSAAEEFDRIFERPAERIEVPPEPQGEAICYTLNGTSAITISEKRPTFLYETPLRP